MHGNCQVVGNMEVEAGELMKSETGGADQV